MLKTVQEETEDKFNHLRLGRAPGPCLSHCLTHADGQRQQDNREEGIFSMDELVS